MLVTMVYDSLPFYVLQKMLLLPVITRYYTLLPVVTFCYEKSSIFIITFLFFFFFSSASLPLFSQVIYAPTFLLPLLFSQ